MLYFLLFASVAISQAFFFGTGGGGGGSCNCAAPACPPVQPPACPPPPVCNTGCSAGGGGAGGGGFGVGGGYALPAVSAPFPGPSAYNQPSPAIGGFGSQLASNYAQPQQTAYAPVPVQSAPSSYVPNSEVSAAGQGISEGYHQQPVSRDAEAEAVALAEVTNELDNFPIKRVRREASVDPKCNSDKLKEIILQNISSDTAESKRKIQREAADKLGGRIDVVCSSGTFSYIVNTELYCETEVEGVTCFAFRQSH